MWMSDKQKSDVIEALLRRVHLDYLWGEEGPTDDALALLAKNGGPLSHGQAIMLKVAFDLWSSSGNASVADLVDVLDDGNLAAVLNAFTVARPQVRLELTRLWK